MPDRTPSPKYIDNYVTFYPSDLGFMSINKLFFYFFLAYVFKCIILFDTSEKFISTTF